MITSPHPGWTAREISQESSFATPAVRLQNTFKCCTLDGTLFSPAIDASFWFFSAHRYWPGAFAADLTANSDRPRYFESIPAALERSHGALQVCGLFFLKYALGSQTFVSSLPLVLTTFSVGWRVMSTTNCANVWIRIPVCFLAEVTLFLAEVTLFLTEVTLFLTEVALFLAEVTLFIKAQVTCVLGWGPSEVTLFSFALSFSLTFFPRPALSQLSNCCNVVGYVLLFIRIYFVFILSLKSEKCLF